VKSNWSFNDQSVIVGRCARKVLPKEGGDKGRGVNHWFPFRYTKDRIDQGKKKQNSLGDQRADWGIKTD